MSNNSKKSRKMVDKNASKTSNENENPNSVVKISTLKNFTPETKLPSISRPPLTTSPSKSPTKPSQNLEKAQAPPPLLLLAPDEFPIREEFHQLLGIYRGKIEEVRQRLHEVLVEMEVWSDEGQMYNFEEKPHLVKLFECKR
jgi:hypothetical protein